MAFEFLHNEEPPEYVVIILEFEEEKGPSRQEMVTIWLSDWQAHIGCQAQM